jgi:hypothetical protein
MAERRWRAHSRSDSAARDRERLQQLANDYAKGRADAADLLEDMEVAQLKLLEDE